VNSADPRSPVAAVTKFLFDLAQEPRFTIFPYRVNVHLIHTRCTLVGLHPSPGLLQDVLPTDLIVEKRIRAKPESAATMPSRESEGAVIPRNLGKTEGREGPLLPSFVQCWERQPDRPREGRLNPGPIELSAKRLRD